jgi:predicted glycosyltransferase involved in capsule biosynthesis
MAQSPDSAPPGDWLGDLDQEYPFANSGVVGMLREAFEKVGGYDERFTDWGGDDDAMRAVLETLWAPATRIGIAYHLWHPRTVEHSPRQFMLADRYGDASGDPKAIERLLAER